MLPLISVFLEKILVLKCILEKTKLMLILFDILWSFSASEEFVDLLIWFTKFVSGFIHVDPQCGNVNVYFHVSPDLSGERGSIVIL